MREIKFLEVGMENYGPYIDPMILTFKEDTLTLLTGPNGVGKTMALDALPFTLYGITSKKMRGDDVVNNVVGKNCKTWVKFKVNADDYLVTRYHKYTKLQNTVVINKNGEDIKKGQKEVLPEIERIVCPQKAFMNTLMFGQKVKDFFTDLVDSDKKEIFRKILGLEQYAEYYKQVDASLKLKESELNDEKNNQSINERLLQEALENIKSLKEQRAKFNLQKNETIKNLKKSIESNSRILADWVRKKDELESEDLDVDKTTEEIHQLEIKESGLAQKYMDMYRELDSGKKEKLAELKASAQQAAIDAKNKMQEDIDRCNEKISELKIKMFDLESDLKDQIHKLELEGRDYTARKNSADQAIISITNDVFSGGQSQCPTCGQMIGDDLKKSFQDQIREYENEIDLCKQQIDQIQIEVSQLNEKIEMEKQRSIINIQSEEMAISTFKGSFRDEAEQLDNRYKSAVKQVEEVVKQKEKEIRDTSNNDVELKNMEKLKNDLKAKKEKQQDLLTEINHIQVKIDNIKNEIEKTETGIEYTQNQKYDDTQLKSYERKKVELKLKLEQDKELIKLIEKESEILKFWKGAFSASGIPSMLIDEAIPFMNAKVSEYLDMITNGRYIVSFDTLDETKSGQFRDKISVRVIDTFTQANSRIQLSGGQTRLIDIATILTLGDLQTAINNVNFNILLFDEIFDALDFDNATYVSKVLHKLKAGKSIYIISHQHEEQLEQDEKLELA
jgi:DNA repair exonuclease SbcCD ATPase subunit